MRYFIFSCLICLVSRLGAGGSLLQIKSSNGEDLPFALVVQKCLNCAGNTKVKSDYSDHNGEVEFAFNGLVEIVVSYVGYEQYLDTLMVNRLKGLHVLELKVVDNDLQQVVVTAQINDAIAANSVHKIKVIDKQRIEHQGAVNLEDLLMTEGNIRISQDPVLGSGISMQGISGENVKILIDGVPLIGRMNGNIDLSQINLTEVERIEIIEGPLSVSYGTNAMAGTINIITKKIKNKKVSGGLSAYYETVGQYNLNANIGVKKGKNKIGFSAARNFFDGWSDEDYGQRYSEWNPKEQYLAKAQYTRVLKLGVINYSTEFFDELITNRGVPRQPFFETAFDDFYHTKRISNALNWKQEVKKNQRFDFVVGYNFFERTKNTFFIDLTTLDESLTNSSGDQDTSRFDLFMTRGTYNITPDSTAFAYQMGFDINIDYGHGLRINNGFARIGDYAVFGNIEWKGIKNLNTRLGLRAAHNTNYKAPVIPSLNLKYHLGKSVLRASYGQGFRAPNLKELYFLFVDINHNIRGNLGLRPEFGENYQLNWDYSTQGKKMQQVTVSTGLFYNDIDNLITLAQTNENGLFSYVNIGNQSTQGVKLNTTFTVKQLQFSLGGNYLGISNDLPLNMGIQRFNYTHELLGNLQYKFSKKRTVLSAYFKHTGRQVGFYLNENDELSELFLDGFSMLDASITKRFWKKYASITAGCKNVMNVTNIAAQMAGGAHSAGGNTAPVAWGRSGFVQLRFNW